MNHPLVSILMAAKDTDSYLPECLDSILAQTYEHWELIIGNDHSTDQTPQILKKYVAKDSRISTFDSQRHQVIPTLKEAYTHAKGTLIHRMDSDDKMPSNKLGLLVSAWKKKGQGHLLSGKVKYFVAEGEVGDGFLRYERWLNEVAKNNTYYQNIYQECVLPSNGWIIHKDDFDRVDAFNPEVYPEDYDLCFRCYKARLKIIGINEVVHLWRDRPDRISRTLEVYKDNRFFDLKLHYFYSLDRDFTRPLIVWGVGKNGKKLAKLLLKKEPTFHWVCNNERKIGKDIYGIIITSCETIPQLNNPQILIVVASPNYKIAIETGLKIWKKKPIDDYWFFL